MVLIELRVNKWLVVLWRYVLLLIGVIWIVLIVECVGVTCVVVLWRLILLLGELLVVVWMLIDVGLPVLLGWGLCLWWVVGLAGLIVGRVRHVLVLHQVGIG